MENSPPGIRRLAEKMSGVLLVAAVVLAAIGGWLFVRDKLPAGSGPMSPPVLAQLEARWSALDAQVDQLAVELAPEQQELMGAEKELRETAQMQRTWEWFGQNRAQQRAVQKKLVEAKARSARAGARVAAQRKQLSQATWARDAARAELDRLQATSKADAEQKAELFSRLEEIWLRLRSVFFLGLALCLLVALLPALLARRLRRARRSVSA